MESGALVTGWMLALVIISVITCNNICFGKWAGEDVLR